MATFSDSITFERYDEEFTGLLQQIEKSLTDDPPSPYVSGLLRQCDDLIKQMAVEARSVSDASLKSKLLDKVKECKRQYQRLEQQSERQSLLSSNGRNGSSGSSTAQQQRAMLQKNEDSLSKQNESLERARRTMEETEQVALEITEELGQNREKLLSAHGRIREVSGLTGRARRILQSMNQRAVQQKLIMYAVAVGLVLAFFIMLWAMWH